MTPPQILLLDDDPYFRRLIVPALESRGYRVLEAAKGFVARRIMSEENVQLAIIDGLLPDVSGLDFIKEVRKNSPNLPIVFVSAFYRDPESYKRLTQELRVARVLYKPFSADVLADHLDELMPSPAGAAEAPGGRSARLDSREIELSSLQGLDIPEMTDADQEVFLPESELDSLPPERPSHPSLSPDSASDVPAPLIPPLAAPSKDLAPSEGTEVARLSLARITPVGSVTAAREEPRSRIVGPRVLLVDDDAFFAEHLESVAKQQLFSLDVAKHLDEVPRFIRGGACDIALVSAPLGDPMSDDDRSGEAIHHLAQAGVPTAVLALDESLDVRIAATQAGARIVLAHPIDDEVLTRTIRELSVLNPHQTLRMGLISDDADLERLVADTFSAHGHDVARLDAETSLFTNLDALAPDAILIDDSVAQGRGVALSGALRATTQWSETPIFMIVPISTAEGRSSSLLAGADDLLPLDEIPRWMHAVEARLGQRRLHYRRSDRDPVTGLPIRPVLLPRLSARLSEAKRHRHPFTVAVVEVQKLRAIQHRYGRAGRQRVLRGLSHLLAGRLRLEDIRGHWNDETFVLGLAGVSASSVRPVIRRMELEFGGIEFRGEDGNVFRAKFRSGLASYPDSGVAVDELLRTAEEALDR